MVGIDIHYQLEVLAGQRIIVPGCEPTSYVSSRALNYAYQNQMICGVGYVDLKVALEAIPGSTVKFFYDFGKNRSRTLFFVFPASNFDCPCDQVIDYYKLLKELARPLDTVQTSYDYCNLNDQGYCPSPDFDSIPQPPSDPYMDEAGASTYSGGGGILPPIPPWAL